MRVRAKFEPRIGDEVYDGERQGHVVAVIPSRFKDTLSTITVSLFAGPPDFATWLPEDNWNYTHGVAELEMAEEELLTLQKVLTKVDLTKLTREEKYVRREVINRIGDYYVAKSDSRGAPSEIELERRDS